MRKDICIQTIFHTKTIQPRKSILITIRRKKGNCIPSLLIKKRSMCKKILTKNTIHN